MQHDINQINSHLCKRKLSIFVKEFWDVIVPNDLVWNWHMDVLCDEIQAVDERVFRRLTKENDLIINVPPGTSKTLLVSVFATAWEFCRMPSIRVFVGSYSDSAVSGIADNIRLVMKSEKYKLYFPEVNIRSDKDSNHNFKTVDNGEFYAFTVGGTLTSKHADILKIDDPINPKKATSGVEIDGINAFFDRTLPTRKVDKNVTPTILIMQRLSSDDPTGYLLSKGKETTRHICLPATLSADVTPTEYRGFYKDGLLDSNRLGLKVLQELKQDLGSYGYAGQIMQSPAPAGGEIWQKWFIPIDDAKFPTKDMMIRYGTDWDLAYTDDEDNAANAYFTAGKIGNQIYIDDFDYQWHEFPKLIKWMKTKHAPHYIEAKACFVEGTLVRTNQGLKAINEISEGDMVMSVNIKSKKTEYKKVLVRFTHVLPQHSIKLITFKLFQFTIKCTSNHEFYINGSWHSAGAIAERIMGVRCRNKSALSNFQHGQAGNYQLQRPIRKRAKKVYAACARSVRVPEDRHSHNSKKTSRDGENAQACCSGIYSKPIEYASGAPRQCKTRRQQSREFRVGNLRCQQSPCNENGASYRVREGDETEKPFKGIKGTQRYFKRAKGKRNQRKIQTKGVHKKDACGRIWSKYSQHNRRYIRKGLEARELNLFEIKGIQVSYEEIVTYDLSVEDNFNYCITDNNILVHNSGKSAKQVLVTNGIPAIEVKMGTGDKVARARSVTPTVEAGMVCIRRSLLDKLYHDDKQGILQFPKSKYKDVADALAQCITRLKTKGIVSATGSEQPRSNNSHVNTERDLLEAL